MLQILINKDLKYVVLLLKQKGETNHRTAVHRHSPLEICSAGDMSGPSGQDLQKRLVSFKSRKKETVSLLHSFVSVCGSATRTFTSSLAQESKFKILKMTEIWLLIENHLLKKMLFVSAISLFPKAISTPRKAVFCL